MMGDMNFGVNILPTNNSFTLGNNEKQWNGAYIANLNASNVTSGILPSSVLPTATTASLGAIKISETTGSLTQTYGIVLNEDLQAYVGVPWTDEKVKMTDTTTNSAYPILFRPDNQTTVLTDSVFCSQGGLTFNPNSNVLTAGLNSTAIFSYFDGLAAGAITANTAIVASRAIIANRENFEAIEHGVAYFGTSSSFCSTGAPSGDAPVLIYDSQTLDPRWGKLAAGSFENNSVSVDNLINKTITLGSLSATLGGGFTPSDVIIELGLNKVLTYRGTTETLQFSSVRPGDVWFLTVPWTSNDNITYPIGVYAYNGTGWDSLGSAVAYKITQEPYFMGYNPSTLTPTATTFIKSISQSANGNITATTASLPTATTASLGLLKVGGGLTVESALTANNEVNPDAGRVSVSVTTVAPRALGQVASTGSEDSFSRSDHVHQLAHLTTTVQVSNTTVTATDQYWYQSDSNYLYDIPHTFVTTNPPTDIQAEVFENYIHVRQTLTVSTDTAGTIQLKCAKLPTGSFKLKISMDKTLT